MVTKQIRIRPVRRQPSDLRKLARLLIRQVREQRQAAKTPPPSSEESA